MGKNKITKILALTMVGAIISTTGVAVISSPTKVSAVEANEEANYKYTLNESAGTCFLDGYIGEVKEVINVPNSINGYKVIGISPSFSVSNGVKYVNLQGIDNKSEINVSPTVQEKLKSEGVLFAIDNIIFENDGVELSLVKDLNQGRTTLSIPSSIGNYPISTIKTGCFTGITIKDGIIIPENIKKIGYRAFYNVNSPYIYVPDGVQTIGEKAFEGANLRCLRLPNSFAFNNGYINGGDYYINGVGSSSKVNITDGYLLFAYNTDENGNKLSVSILKLLPSEYPLEKYSIPSSYRDYSVTKIEPMAFAGNETLKEIELPDTITEIGEGAFSGCKNLSAVGIPFNSSIKEIKAETFKDTVSLKAISLPNSIETVGEKAFSNTGLFQLSLSPSLREIKSRAFENCKELSHIYISSYDESKLNIAKDVFGNESQWNNPTITVNAVTIQVIFRDYDGKEISSQNVKYGEDAIVPSIIPVRDGYRFVGWDKPTTGITGNTEITAKYEKAEKYTVTFKDYDGTTLLTQVVYKGDKPNAPEPNREGYIFTGWDKDISSINGDLVVTAQYSVDTFDAASAIPFISSFVGAIGVLISTKKSKE